MKGISSFGLPYRFQAYYGIAVVLIFLLEIWIAFFNQNGFIRAYLGDFFVVILIYCTLKTFLKLPVFTTSIGVLLFAYCIEISQYFHFIRILGLEKSSWAHLILGSQFEWWDLLCYTMGILVTIFIEQWKKAGFPAYRLIKRNIIGKKN